MYVLTYVIKSIIYNVLGRVLNCHISCKNKSIKSCGFYWCLIKSTRTMPNYSWGKLWSSFSHKYWPSSGRKQQAKQSYSTDKKKKTDMCGWVLLVLVKNFVRTTNGIMVPSLLMFSSDWWTKLIKFLFDRVSSMSVMYNYAKIQTYPKIFHRLIFHSSLVLF